MHDIKAKDNKKQRNPNLLFILKILVLLNSEVNFHVTLPNRNELPLVEGIERTSGSKKESLKDEKELIIDFVSENGSITRKQTEELIDAGTTKAFRMLRELCESGKLTAVGKGKISKYVLKWKSQELNPLYQVSWKIHGDFLMLSFSFLKRKERKKEKRKKWK